MRNWASVMGNGLSLFGSEQSGVPRSSPSWEYRRPKKGAFPDTGRYIIFEDKLLFLGAHSSIGCIDVGTGELRWLIEKKTENPYFFSTNGQFLVMEPYILNADSGRLVIDYSTALQDYEPTPDSRPVINSKWMIKSWKEFSSERGLLAVNLDSQTVRRLSIDAFFPELVNESDRAIVATRDGLACVDLISEKYIWRSPIEGINPREGVVISVFEDVATAFVRGQWYLVSVEDGRILRKVGYTDMSSELTGSDYSVPRTGRQFYVYGRKRYPHLIGYDVLTGRTIFDKPISHLRGYCIAGDLLFAIRDLIDDKNYRDSELIALDRFTGEEVWKADTPLAAAFDVKACGSNVFFSSVSGILRCYKWDETYISNLNEGVVEARPSSEFDP